jgi:hypothetical protein
LDQELAQRLTFSVPAAPLSVVLEQLAAQTGISLRAGAMVRDVVSVRVNDVPLNELMRRLAESTACEWVVEEGGFRLAPDPGAQNIERTAELRARTEAWRRAIAMQVEQSGQGPELTLEDARREVEAGARPPGAAGDGIRARRGGPGGATVRPRTLALAAPGARAVARLLNGIDPAEFAAMPPGGRLVFTPAPTAMQRPLRAWRPVVAQLAREMSVFRQAAQERDPSIWMPGTPLGADAPPGEPASATLIALRQGFQDVVTLHLAVWDAQGAPVAQIRGALMTQPVGQAERTPISEPEPLALSADAQSFARLFAGRADVARGSEVIIVRTSGDEEPMVITGTLSGPANAAPPEWRERILNPERYEPLAHLTGEVLHKTAEREGANLVAVLPDSLVGDMARAFSNASMGPKEVLRRLQAQWGMSVASDGGWLIVRPSQPQAARDERVDRAALGRLLRALTARGWWTVDEMAAYAATRPQGLGVMTLDHYFCRIVNPDADQRLFDPLSGQAEALRVWGLLSSGQRNVLLDGRPLQLGALNQPLLETLHRMVYFSREGPDIQAPGLGGQGAGRRGGLGRWTMGMDDPLTERTYVLPNGVPRDGALTARVTRTPVAIGVADDGRFGVARSAREIAMARTVLLGMGDGEQLPMGRAYPRYVMAERVSIRLQLALSPRATMARTVGEVNLAQGARAAAFEQLPEAFRRQVEEASRAFGRGARREVTREVQPPPTGRP